MDTFHLVPTGISTNASVVRKGPCGLSGWYILNTNAAVRCVKIYDSATTPEVGTDVPKITIALPPGGAANLSLDEDIKFQKGLAIATTTGVADNNASATASEDLVINLFHR